MQPYLFPYVGYFQLAMACDVFVFLEDVTYIKQGWINRNRLLQKATPVWFTVPLSSAGSHALIRDIAIDGRRYAHWRTKFFAFLQHEYRKAANFARVLSLLENVFPNVLQPSAGIATVAAQSVALTLAYLGIPFNPAQSSQLPNSTSARGVDRVLQICGHYGARTYVNSAGGRTLYEAPLFQQHGYELKFIKPGARALQLAAGPDGSQLSLLHGLMHHDPAFITEALTDFELE